MNAYHGSNLSDDRDRLAQWCELPNPVVCEELRVRAREAARRETLRAQTFGLDSAPTPNVRRAAAVEHDDQQRRMWILPIVLALAVVALLAWWWVG